jgi:molybdopterin biosynthesis enzyme
MLRIIGGEDVLSGPVIASEGTVLRPAHVGLITMQGKDRVNVFRRLRVAILTAGDELVSAGNTNSYQQSFGSNGPTLTELVRSMGGICGWCLARPG